MVIGDFFFPVVSLNGQGEADRHLGTAFAVAPDGTLVTCRHVVDINADTGVGVIDLLTGQTIRVDLADVVFRNSPPTDLAFLPPLPRAPQKGLPLLTPQLLVMGEDVYSFGFYSPTSMARDRKTGYFKGALVSIDPSEPLPGLTLPYPVVEGLSGAPVLTYHNGPKVVGVCHGSESQRVLASEVVDYEEGDVRMRETVHRIVEFGQAYHGIVLGRALVEAGRQPIISDETVALPGI